MGIYSALKSLESPAVYSKFLNLPIAKQAFGGTFNNFANVNPLQAASGMNICNNVFVTAYGASTGNTKMALAGLTFMGANILLGLEPDKLQEGTRLHRFFKGKFGSKIARNINFQFTSKIIKVGAGGFMFLSALPTVIDKIKHGLHPNEDDKKKNFTQKANDMLVLIDSSFILLRGCGSILANAAYAPIFLKNFGSKYPILAARLANIGSFGNQIGATTGAIQSIIGLNVFNLASAVCNYVGNVFTNRASELAIKSHSTSTGASFFKDVLIPGIKKNPKTAIFVGVSALGYMMYGAWKKRTDIPKIVENTQK